MPTIALIVLLVLAGMVFILFELLTPTFGVLAGAALVSLAGAVWLGFTVSAPVGVGLIAAIVAGVPIYVVALVRMLPKMPFGRALFMGKAPSAAATGTPEVEKQQALVGQVGVAETTLRPSGAVRVAGQRVVGMAESGLIEQGAKVKVVSTDGMNLLVRKVD